MRTYQVYRITQKAASVADKALLDRPSAALARVASNKEQTVYGMVDGSMLLTHEGWQETKVGRVFKATAVKESKATKWQINLSEYVAQRGHYSEFTAKFETLLPPGSACKKVLISDGALWIAHWLSERYGTAVHILDFYHVSEKLAAAAQYSHDTKGWLDRQCEQLLAGRLERVLEAVKKIDALPAVDKEKLLYYLQSNAYRMHYDQYRKQGLMISSGPIESAHRTVLQVRMKRSGQRWSEKGCDHMTRLRVAYKSEKFDLITDLFKQQVA